MAFSMNNFEYDEKHCLLNIGGELMVYHCHHYLTNLQRTIFDAEYMDGMGIMIGCGADSSFYQLTNLCAGLDTPEAKTVAQDVYKSFGNGLLDLTSMNEDGATIVTTKSVISKTWLMQFEESKNPVDGFTAGYLAAAYAVIYKKELKDVHVVQTEDMACGADANVYVITNQPANFPLYPKKGEVKYNEAEQPASSWEHADLITTTFSNAHKNFVGNEEGFIPAFGVYVVNNQSDYVNRLQFEFMKEVEKFAGEYGQTLAGELLMEAGVACGFFTLGGILSSPEWEGAVKPYLKTPEDWVHAAIALTNNMGWGYQVVPEISKEKMIFRNYNDFEDISYMRMYGKSKTFTHWANSGGWSAIMPIIYNSDLLETGEIAYLEMYEEIRRSKYGYKLTRTKGISNGDDYLEMEVKL